VRVESNLGFDSMRMGMSICISQYLECDPANVVLGGWGQSFPVTLLDQVEDRRSWFSFPEAATCPLGVELMTLLTARKLLILGSATKPKTAPFTGSSRFSFADDSCAWPGS
jgi:hypothetical protein